MTYFTTKEDLEKEPSLHRILWGFGEKVNTGACGHIDVSECKRAGDPPLLVLVGHRSLLRVSECALTYIHICLPKWIPHLLQARHEAGLCGLLDFPTCSACMLEGGSVHNLHFLGPLPRYWWWGPSQCVT